MKIVSWNCRGMGSRIKEEAIRSLIRTEAPDILLIQETKLEDSVFLQASKKLWNKCEHLDSKEIISLFNVYIPVNTGEKKACWESIRNQAVLINLENTIIVGDLNLTLLSADKRGGSIVRDLAWEWVEDLMQDWDLLDINPISGNYTCSNKRISPGHIAARLDRFLLQSSFLLLGLEARVHILPCSTSDHKPIKMELVF
eukprot:PITA_18092